MALLPAVVPDIPEARAEVVPARLARKVAPLFGIRWEQSPYGLTWVCDYTQLTLSEIARGAPGPLRAEAARWEKEVPAGQWRAVGRSVITHRRPGAAKPEPLPNEIANATLNRFGPDTKAAVILTAANKLLEPVTEAINDALAFLAETSVGDLSLRLGAWASLVLEVFRSQPALFAAAVQAREIQRAASLRWFPFWDLPKSGQWTMARCEIGASEPSESTRGSLAGPGALDVVDSTLRAVRLPVPARDRGPVVDDLVRRWLRHLMALGTFEGDGYLWPTERTPGHRVVEAFAPHDPTLQDYLNEAVQLIYAYADDDVQPPRAACYPAIPPPEAIAGFGELSRRAIVLALGTMVRTTFNSGDLDPGDQREVVATFDQLATLAWESLGEDDPALAVTLCRVADMRLEALRQDEANDRQLGGAVADLLAQLDRSEDLVERGVLNQSDAAELIRSANVEIAILLRRHTARPIPGLPPADALTARLYRSWDAFLRLMEIDLEGLSEQPEAVRRLVGYQLHNYASFLAGRGRTEADLSRALELFEEFVVPARNAFYHRTGNFGPLLYSYQNATRATTELARRSRAHGRLQEARRYAMRGRAWIWQALNHRDTQDKLDRASDEACRFALLAAPALLTAVELAATDSAAGDLAECERLLAIARTFADRIAKAGGRYARADEITDIERRLGACRGAS